jgi:elongation factor G
MHDQQLGTLTFLRVFSGSLQHGHKAYNVSRLKHEKIAKIYLPLADELVETNEANEGEVVIVSGLKVSIPKLIINSSCSHILLQ